MRFWRPRGFSPRAELENGREKIDEFNVFQMSSRTHVITPRKRMDHHHTKSGEGMLIAHQTGRRRCHTHGEPGGGGARGGSSTAQINAIHLPFVYVYYSIFALRPRLSAARQSDARGRQTLKRCVNVRKSLSESSRQVISSF